MIKKFRLFLLISVLFLHLSPPSFAMDEQLDTEVINTVQKRFNEYKSKIQENEDNIRDELQNNNRQLSALQQENIILKQERDNAEMLALYLLDPSPTVRNYLNTFFYKNTPEDLADALSLATNGIAEPNVILEINPQSSRTETTNSHNVMYNVFGINKYLKQQLIDQKRNKNNNQTPNKKPTTTYREFRVDPVDETKEIAPKKATLENIMRRGHSFINNNNNNNNIQSVPFDQYVPTTPPSAVPQSRLTPSSSEIPLEEKKKFPGLVGGSVTPLTPIEPKPVPIIKSPQKILPDIIS